MRYILEHYSTTFWYDEHDGGKKTKKGKQIPGPVQVAGLDFVLSVLGKISSQRNHRDWRSVNPRNDSLKSTLSPYLLENFLLLQDKKRWWTPNQPLTNVSSLWQFERIFLCTEQGQTKLLWNLPSNPIKHFFFFLFNITEYFVFNNIAVHSCLYVYKYTLSIINWLFKNRGASRLIHCYFLRNFHYNPIISILKYKIIKTLNTK